MVGEVVFHLGDCKTGTTSIQRTFSAGGVRPASGGPTLYYPPGVNHIPLASSLTRTHEMPHADRRFERMSALLAQSRADVGVISAETFEFVDPEILARRIERHFKPWKDRIRFISYVRPHAERLVSGFAERTKQGNHLGSLEEFFEIYLERGTFHYAPRVARWRAAFGSAHEVRPMVRAHLKDGDVVADFVDYVLRGAPAEIRVVAANESLTTADLAALRALHKGFSHYARGRIRDTRITFGWNFAGLLSDLPRPEGAEKPQLDRALAERVVQAYAADAAEMDRLYFDGTPLSDALAATPGRARAEPQPIAPEAYFDPAGLRVLSATSALLARMFDHAPEMQRQAMRSPAADGTGRPKRAKKRKDRARRLPQAESLARRIGRRLPARLWVRLRPLARRLLG